MNEPPPIQKLQKSASDLANVISSTTESTTTKVDLTETAKEESQKLAQDQLEEIRKKKLDNDRLQADVDKIRNDNKSRIAFSSAIFIVTVIWMFCILTIVKRAGSQIYKLSDTVLVTLITTTTANVFGFLYVVVNYLFNKDKST